MFTAALALTDNRASVTLPGSLGALTFDQVTGPSGQTIVRRISSTANTTPNTLTTSHTLSGAGFKQRCRSLVRIDFTRRDVDVASTGGVVPSVSGYFVLDRPIQNGGFITTTHIKTLIGQLCDFLTVSGNVDKFINQEG